MHLACAALLLGACSSFDKSLIDYASVTPHDGPSLHDAGHHPAEPNENPPHEMQGTGGHAAHDAGSISGKPDAGGHMSPPENHPQANGMDAGRNGDDDAGQGETDQGDAGSPPVCEPVQVADYCEQVPALQQAPVIDGTLDCGPPLLSIAPQAWNGTVAMPVDHVAKLALATRNDGLYVYVEVHGTARLPHPSGSSIYCGDAVELYIDADATFDAAGAYDKPGTMQFIVAAPTAAGAGVDAMRYVQGADHSAWLSTQVQTAVLSDGYAIEAFITAADLDLGSWTPSSKLGFDLAIDVSAPSGTTGLKCGLQLGQYFMRVADMAGSCNHEPWCNTLALCAPAL